MPRRRGDDTLRELRWNGERRDLAEPRRDIVPRPAQRQTDDAKLCGGAEDNVEGTLTDLPAAAAATPAALAAPPSRAFIGMMMLRAAAPGLVETPRDLVGSANNRPLRSARTLPIAGNVLKLPHAL